MAFMDFDIDISDEDIKHIVKWCEENGFPFAASPGEGRKPKCLFGTFPPNRIGFFVRDFLSQLNELCSAFLLYQIITRDETDQEQWEKSLFWKTALILDPQKAEVAGPRPLIELSHNTNVEECRKLFEAKYQEITFTNQISFEGEMHLTVKTQNLFDAAFYQLALLLNGPAIEIGKCDYCYAVFPKEHRSQKYCKTPATTPGGKIKYKNNGEIKYTCDPAKAHARKKRAKQKKDGSS